MVTNIGLPKQVRKIEAFIDLTDERLDDPTLIYLLTQICEMKMKFEVFHSEFGLYRTDIKDNLEESLSFCEAATLQFEGMMKDNEALRTKFVKVLKEK